jgi:predicted DCC family thiol-disulfide oxidoreductase YuxK
MVAVSTRANAITSEVGIASTSPALSPVASLLLMLQGLERTLVGFFSGPSHPLNLAIVRILVFADCLVALNADEILSFSRLPTILQFPPRSLAGLAPHVPISPQLASVGIAIFIVGACLGIVGLFTRWAALAVVASGIYVLGIPQLFGKVDHYHHVIWFASILAFSPCGEFLSLDAVRRGWAAADRKQTVQYAPSAAYGLPLRLIWILIGFIYLFPGLYKARMSGLQWAVGPGFANILHQKWFELGWWTPFMRIDEVPLLLTVAALGTMLFEVTFIFLVLPRRTRPIPLVAGSAFHFTTNVFMQIWFWDLNVLYLAFIDIERGVRAAGRKLFPSRLRVFFDGSCQVCRRTIGVLRAVDVLDRIQYVDANDRASLDLVGQTVDTGDVLTDLHVCLDEKTWRGYYAYREISKRIPILWPVVPFLFLPPVAAVGTAWYRRVATSRHCRIETQVCSAAVAVPRTHRASRAVAAIGATLIVLNGIAGLKGITSWPIAIYPTFAPAPPPFAPVITMEMLEPDGHTQSVVTGQQSDALPIGSERLSALAWAVASMQQGPKQQEALRALASMYREASPSIASASSIDFYRDEYMVAPEHRGEPPVSREFLFRVVQ